MATTLSGPAYASDWLKGEAHSGEYFSRDTIIIASGQGVLVTGTVLAKVTATGKYVVAAATGSDGSQTAAAILFDQVVDATSADKVAVAVTRQATVSHQGLVYGPTLSSPTLRAAAAAQLAAVGIVDRQGA